VRSCLFTFTVARESSIGLFVDVQHPPPAAVHLVALACAELPSLFNAGEQIDWAILGDDMG